LKGSIDLSTAREVKAVPDNEKRFIIVTPDRTWRLEASDLAERTGWVNAVRAVLPSQEEEVEAANPKKNDSVLGPGEIQIPDKVPEHDPMQPGSQIKVVNGKVSDADYNQKRDPAAAGEKEEEAPARRKRDPSIVAEDLQAEKQKALEDFDKVFASLCSLVDSNHDDVIRLKEFSEMYPEWSQNFFSKFFENLDKNMDDGLSKDEFRQMFVLQGGKLDTTRVRETIMQILSLKFDKVFDDVCLIIDKNYDGKFDFNEFAAFHPGASEAFFKGLDLNKDNVLSKEELKEYYRLEDGSLDTPRVTKDLEKLEENIYQQDIETLCQMVNEDHAKDVIDIQEFKGVYPEGTKVFIAAIGGDADGLSFQYDEVVKSFRDEEGWGDFLKVRQVIKDMKEAMFNTHFDGLCTMMDKDHNDTLDFQEFEQIYPTATQIFFNALDTNGDKKLQKSELRASFVLADGSMDVERMAQIEADMKEKIEAKNKAVDDHIDDFLEADEKDALSPDDLSEFDEPDKTPEKKADTPVVEEKKEEKKEEKETRSSSQG